MVFTDQDMARADWPLLRNGAVNLFVNMALFERAIDDLTVLDYLVLRLRFETMEEFCQDLSRALKWHEQFGYSPWAGNLDALNDGLRGEPFNSASDTAVCIENFDALVMRDDHMSFTLLDLIERHSRYYLLFGKRLIGLIQTNDPDYHCDGIGGAGASWNEAEWLDSSREPGN